MATLLGALLVFLILDALYPFPLERLEREPAVVVTDREGVPLRMFLPSDETWRLPLRVEELPPDLVRAVVACEDRRFHAHPGVDPLAVARATVQNLRAGRVVSGASTIPMQVARMVEPKERTPGAKVREAFRALQLEWRFSKRELLEIYLNLAPYGGNIEGVGAAAWFYFGKAPDRLSLGEIALLTALPRSPAGYDPTRNPEAAHAAKRSVLERLLAAGIITADQKKAALRQELPRARRQVPFEAPHLARHVADRFGGLADGWLVSSVDRRMQCVAESAVDRRIAGLRDAGIGNAAVVVLENRTRAVRALVGSAGFFDADHHGQVDGTVARRSPGSALKPFLYALAMDEGRLVPDSFLLDVPTDFSGYVAKNYDGRYRGRVTARQALAESLNAPAVRLLGRVGLERFLEFLREGGLTTLERPAGRYGLPLALGAAEVTLLELTNLYATLASGGERRGVVLLEPSGADARLLPDRLVSPESARLVTEILLLPERPDLPGSWELARDVPAVAWKTGTSYGHRDAWAVGFSERYTIGTWCGNFDGTPAKGISGARHAGPLLFDLFRALEPGGGASRLPRPRGLRIESTEVCARSHERPGPFCPRTRFVETAPSTRLPECRLHRRIFVDAESGGLLAAGCGSRHARRTKVIESHPAELVAWWRAQGRAVDGLPPLAPGCGEVPPRDPPRIVSPDPSTPYRLRLDIPLEYQKVALLARSANPPGAAAGRLFWYQDGRLVASATPNEQAFLELAPGNHRLVVVDESGRSDAVSYLVE